MQCTWYDAIIYIALIIQLPSENVEYTTQTIRQL
jgi:hypothetical protein